jgi:hypothetical protein
MTNGNAAVDSFHHLKAIQTFLTRVQKTKQLDTSIYGFLVEAYAYIAVIADFSMTIYSEEWRCEDSTILYSTRLPGIHCGCAASLFALIPSITTLASNLALERENRFLDVFHTEAYTPLTTSFYNSLHQEISNWKVPCHITDPALIGFGRIYQQAMLLCLQITFYQHSVQSDELSTLVQSYIDHIITLFKDIPANSTVNTTICWPLAVLGSCVTTVKDREFVTHRLDDMYGRFHFGNLLETRKFLQTLWDQIDEGSRSNMFMSPTDIQNAILTQNRTIVFV